MEVSADAVDALPTFQLNELVAELGDVGDLGTEDLLAQLAEGAAAPLPGGGEATEAGSRAAADFWRCAQEAGFRALCEALSFSGLQQELPRLFVNGVTVIAPSDAAFAQLSPAARGNFKLVRQLLLAHICPGTHLLEELQSKACAVSLAGQTHAVYARDGGTCVGSARLGRTDVAFEGGIIHEVDSVLVVVFEDLEEDLEALLPVLASFVGAPGDGLDGVAARCTRAFMRSRSSRMSIFSFIATSYLRCSSCSVGS